MDLWIVALLLIKHFVMDYTLQTEYMISNKGLYGHSSGLAHSALHGLGTLFVFSAFGFMELAILLAMIDSFIHYHVDYAKVRISQHYGWHPGQRMFWQAFGVDQLIHGLTYVMLVGLTQVS